MENNTLLHDRYRILDTLGKGGMGAVYYAIDERLGVHVAVKENLLEDEDAISQFRREATILANLRHPNLPRVTDHFVIEGQGQYLVMDYIEGEDLKMRLQRTGALPEKEVLLIGIAIADALEYVHHQSPPVLHRDIKPGNIRITPQGQVYLVDFGLAKQVEGGQATATGARGLTPGYSPPEQYGSARTDPRSDIYGLGATLYTALTGFPPEDGLAIAINQTKLTGLRVRNPNISPRTAEIIEKSLNVKTENRYQSGAEFKQALLEASETINRQVAKGDVTVTPTPSDATRVAGDATIPASLREIPTIAQGARPAQAVVDPPKKSRGWLWVLLGGGALLVLLAAAAVLFLPSLLKNFGSTPLAQAATPSLTAAQPNDTAAATATQAEEVVLVPTATETLAPTATELPMPTLTLGPTPTGGAGMVAFASDRGGDIQIYLMDLESGEVTQLTEINGGACQPTWSPDGMRLAFTAPCAKNQIRYDGSSLFVINVDGTGFAPLPSSPVGDYDPAWSPVDNRIAFTTIRDFDRPQIWLLDVDTGEQTNLSDNVTSDFQPAWSPDGQWIVFSSSRAVGRGNLWAMDPQGQNLIEMSFSDNRTNVEPDWSSDGNLFIFTQFNNTGGGIPRLLGGTWRDGAPRADGEYLVSDDSMSMREPDVSPDNYWIIYAGGPDFNNLDLYMMRINGSEITQITEGESNDFDPAWRPTP